MGIPQNVRAVIVANPGPNQKSFYPWATIKCEGPRMFRSQTSRDVACLLDVERDVRAWVCMPAALGGNSDYVPDFAVFPSEAQPYLLDAPDMTSDLSVRTQSAAAASWRLVAMEEEQLNSGFRLANAKDLLRYANHKTTLGDRVRLLAALDENGSLPFAQCLQAFQETKPIAGLASLILQEYVEIDFDEAPIGPETLVRRIAR
jgi:hypothetical protein